MITDANDNGNFSAKKMFKVQVKKFNNSLAVTMAAMITEED